MPSETSLPLPPPAPPAPVEASTPPKATEPVPDRSTQDRSAEGVQHRPADAVRKGDTVIWMRGGQMAYADGVMAFVSNVYIGGEGVDLLVPDPAGCLVPRSLVSHVSEMDSMTDARVRDVGVWMDLQEHQSILVRDRQDRERRKQSQAASGQPVIPGSR